MGFARIFVLLRLLSGRSASKHTEHSLQDLISDQESFDDDLGDIN